MGKSLLEVLDPEKLLSQGDIEPEEADMIFALFTKTNVKRKLNIFSSAKDANLIIATAKWFDAVEKMLDAGKTGMFVSTIHLVHKINLAIKLSNIDTVSYLAASDAFLSSLPSEVASIVKNWQTNAPGPRPTVSKAIEGTYHDRPAEIQRAGFLRRYGLLPYFDLTSFFRNKDALKLKNKSISSLLSDFFTREELFEVLAYLSLDKINVPYVSVRNISGHDTLLTHDAASALEIVKKEYWPDILKFLCRDCVSFVHEQSFVYVSNREVFCSKGVEALGMAYISALNEVSKMNIIEDDYFFDEIR